MSNKLLPILPGATLGMLGGGQLGRMFTLAARTMGYKVMVLDPDAASPAGQMADAHLQADYTDLAALQKLGESCAAVTTEFENVPAASLIELARHCRVAPGAEAVAIVQDRSHEKSWLAGNGFATAPFALVNSEADLEAALAVTGTPALLKVSRLGYDGKGQIRVGSLDEACAAFREFGGQPCVLEGFVKLEREVSVVLARDDAGQMGGATSTRDDGLEATCFGAGSVFVEQVRRAVRRHHLGLEVDAQLLQQYRRVFHHLPVAGRPHHHSHLRRVHHADPCNAKGGILAGCSDADSLIIGCLWF